MNFNKLVTVEKTISQGYPRCSLNHESSHLELNSRNLLYGNEELAKQAIIEDIVNTFPDSEKIIRDAFLKEQDVNFNVKNNISAFFKPQTKVSLTPNILAYTEYSSIKTSKTFVSYMLIEVENPVYAVIECFNDHRNIYTPISRMYHSPFWVYEEAVNYMNKFQCHDSSITSYIACFDVNKLTLLPTRWYYQQMRVAELLEKYPEFLYDDTFSPYVDRHYENIINKLTPGTV